MAVDAAGNAYLTGHFYGGLDLDADGVIDLTSAGNADIFLAKFNAYPPKL